MENNEVHEPLRTSPETALLPSLDALCELEFVFVTGKGGVGKTTFSSVLALHAANAGKRVLIVYPDDDSMPKSLWGKKLDHVPSPVAESIDAVSINSESSMREYMATMLKSHRLASFLLHSKVAHGLLTGIPGPKDWAILGRAWSWTHSGTYEYPKGQKRYDLVIMDAPSSGDGTGMLRMPQVILDIAPAARFRNDAEICLTSLRDPAKSAVVFVTLLEEMVVAETEENLALVRHDLRMPLGPLVINQVMTPVFSDADRKILTTPETQSQKNASCHLQIARRRALREELQAKHLARLASTQLKLVKLPQIEDDLTSIEALKKLKMDLAEGP